MKELEDLIIDLESYLLIKEKEVLENPNNITTALSLLANRKKDVENFQEFCGRRADVTLDEKKKMADHIKFEIEKITC